MRNGDGDWQKRKGKWIKTFRHCAVPFYSFTFLIFLSASQQRPRSAYFFSTPTKTTKTRCLASRSVRLRQTFSTKRNIMWFRFLLPNKFHFASCCLLLLRLLSHRHRHVIVALLYIIIMAWHAALCCVQREQELNEPLQISILHSTTSGHGPRL